MIEDSLFGEALIVVCEWGIYRRGFVNNESYPQWWNFTHYINQ